jgi:hypothetical protein
MQTVTDLRCLTVQQPYAWAILRGLKRIENRSWRPNYRGRLLLHAAREHSGALELPDGTRPPSRVPLGALVGTVELVDCVRYGRRLRDDPFACGPFCWLLQNPLSLARPIPCKGQLGLWRPRLTASCEHCQAQQSVSDPFAEFACARCGRASAAAL